MIEAQVVGGTIATLAVAGMAFTRMLFNHRGKWRRVDRSSASVHQE
jgi:hypothetical protein